MKHRPLRDACDAYVKAFEAMAAASTPEHCDAFLAAADVVSGILGDSGHMPTVAAARIIRDAINAAWEAGYEERLEDEGK